MKIVLIDSVTGRYYHGPGQWVRRADNARTFDDLSAAVHFSRVHALLTAEPVQRLAPYVMQLLRHSVRRGSFTARPGVQLDRWLAEKPYRFFNN